MQSNFKMKIISKEVYQRGETDQMKHKHIINQWHLNNLNMTNMEFEPLNPKSWTS